jgi:hypothetical protein
MSFLDFESWAGDEITRMQTGTDLRRPSDHQSMFKYVSLNTEASWALLHRTLQHSELSGSGALNLNDPFERSPVIFNDLHPKIIASATGYPRNWLLDEQTSAPEDVFHDVEPYRRQAQSFLDKVAEQYRIVAFCERSDSGLLWSHYANSYQGVCLHFLARGLRLISRCTLGYVRYSKYRPTYPLSLALALASKPGPTASSAMLLKRAESDKILFFTKAEEWSYECELRLVYDSERSPSLQFQRDGLVGIIIGPRMSPENRARLVELIQSSRYKHIAIRDARLSKTTFSVEVEP